MWHSALVQKRSCGSFWFLVQVSSPSIASCCKNGIRAKHVNCQSSHAIFLRRSDSHFFSFAYGLLLVSEFFSSANDIKVIGEIVMLEFMWHRPREANFGPSNHSLGVQSIDSSKTKRRRYLSLEQQLSTLRHVIPVLMMLETSACFSNTFCSSNHKQHFFHCWYEHCTRYSVKYYG